MHPSPSDSDRREVLVIEDDSGVRAWLYACLQKAGFAVSVAPDGPTALGSLLLRSPDLILCDVNMPHLDGYGMLRRCRALPHLSETPFVLMSGDASDARAQPDGLPEGAADFWAKPFDRVRLERGVRALLRG